MENNSHSYNQIEDFLDDLRFISWVKNPTGELDDYWSGWLSDFPEKQELFQQAKILVESIHFQTHLVAETQMERVFENIQTGQFSTTYKEQHGRLVQMRSVLKNSMLQRVAAMLFIFLSIGSLVWFLNYGPGTSLMNQQAEMITVTIWNGEKQTISLPDGSVVYLNSGSKLSYPSFFNNERNIILEGEAFFEVAKDAKRPFIVHSKHLSTTALGTSFNVKAYAGEQRVAVALKTGKVVVKDEGAAGWRDVFLVPGEKVIAENNHVVKTQLSNDDFSWQDGVLVFNSVGFDEFVKIMERWYGVNIAVTGTPGEDWLVNGSFNNKSLAVVLESISFAENIDYALQGNQVKLNFK